MTHEVSKDWVKARDALQIEKYGHTLYSTHDYEPDRAISFGSLFGIILTSAILAYGSIAYNYISSEESIPESSQIDGIETSSAAKPKPYNIT